MLQWHQATALNSLRACLPLPIQELSNLSPWTLITANYNLLNGANSTAGRRLQQARRVLHRTLQQYGPGSTEPAEVNVDPASPEGKLDSPNVNLITLGGLHL